MEDPKRQEELFDNCLKEEKYWRQKQYDHEWNEDKLNSRWCKEQADYWKDKINHGIFWEPKF